MEGGKDINIVSQTEIIPLKGRKVLTLGSSYMSDIFYNHNNKVSPNDKVLIIEDKKVIIRNGQGYTYSNESEGSGEEMTVLHYGDEYRMYGLYMQYLGSIIIVCAYYGELRVAVSKRRI